MSAVDLALSAGVVLTTGWLFFLRRRRARARLARLSRSGPVAASRRSARRPARLGVRLGVRAAAALVERPVATTVAGAALVGGALLLLAGPVAAVVIVLYVVLALAAGHRRLARKAADQALTDLLDAIDTAAGELRAGIVASADLDGFRPRHPEGDGAGRVDGAGRRVTDRRAAQRAASRTERRARRLGDAAIAVAVARLEAAHRVSSALGMPLADLLDRVDADLRSAQALRVNITAQTSSAQATAVLLLGLPLVGLWLGAALGVDPVGQLLHTRLGAGCALIAVALQCAGLLWTSRMVRGVTTEVR